MFIQSTIVALFFIHGARLSPLEPLYNLDMSLDYFLDFVKKYDKVYEQGEAAKRFQTFTDNLADLNRFNEDHEANIFHVHAYSDLSYEEVRQTRLGGIAGNLTGAKPTADMFEGLQVKQAPAAFDWRDAGVLTPIKNQGTCGSCWAHATVAMVESQFAIKYQQHLDLSEQQLVDCDTRDNGCKGGNAAKAVTYLSQDSGGLMTEADYPYRGENNSSLPPQCFFQRNKIAVNVVNSNYLVNVDEERIKTFLFNYGPVAVGMEWSPTLTHGFGVKHIIAPRDCGQLKLVNHMVNIVGYGTDNNGTPYWIIRNSHGLIYGDQGYFRFIRGRALCLITGVMAYLTIA